MGPSHLTIQLKCLGTSNGTIVRWEPSWNTLCEIPTCPLWAEATRKLAGNSEKPMIGKEWKRWIHMDSQDTWTPELDLASASALPC